MPCKATQKILDLVDSLYRRGRIIDGRRERLDGDIDKQPNWIFGILLERALGLEMNEPDQILFGKPNLVPVNPHDNAAIDKGIAHSGDHLDDCATAFCLLH